MRSRTDDSECFSLKACANSLFTLAHQPGLVLIMCKCSEIILSLRRSLSPTQIALSSLCVHSDSITQMWSLYHLSTIILSSLLSSEYSSAVLLRNAKLPLSIRKLICSGISPLTLIVFVRSLIVFCRSTVFPNILREHLYILKKCIRYLSNNSHHNVSHLI